VKPDEGIFLEFSPIQRSWDIPIAQEGIGREKKKEYSHSKLLQYLKDNLTVFPIETAVVLEYWLDVSLFSWWQKPAVKLPWNKTVFEADLKTYGELGIRNITTFAAYIDDKYIANHKDLSFLKEYGEGLKNFEKGKETSNKSSEYTVNTIDDGLISVDGERTDAAWNNSTDISSFVNPWNPSVCPKTSLRMLKDSRYLYFFFNVNDDDILLESEFSHKLDIVREDRTELFFSKDKDMNDYYCFEIDALGRTLAYSCSYYRKYNYLWEPPEGFITSARIRSDGYSVEGAFPLEFIRDFIQSDGSVYMGAYRAEFSKKDNVTVENWLTWINPQTAQPDFHVPSSMGKLRDMSYEL
jgi:hypothetical protein